jgi:hypothetical protein
MTSGSFDFSQNRDELIKDSFITAGVEDVFDTPESEFNQYASKELNRMIKGWMADGLHLWAIQPAYLFLEKDKREYSLGTDHFTKAFVSTTVKVAGVDTDTSLDVASTTGVTAGDYCLVAMDDGTLHTTTVAVVVDADTVTLNDALDGAVAVGRAVYFYTTKAIRPIRVQQGVYHDFTGDYDTRMYQISRDEFWALSSKGTDSRPSQWYFDPQLTASKLRIYGEPSSVQDYLILVAHFPFDDMDAAADNFSFPQEWYDPIHWNLAYRLAMQFGAPRDRVINCRNMAIETKDRAMGWDEERSEIQLRPDVRWLQG